MGLSSFPKKRGIKERIPIPMDLVMEEILTRLPAKSLMRFKCVSKLWSCHIRSRYFSNRFLTVPSRPRPRLYMCLADPSYYRETVILSSAPDTTTPSSFVVDHDLTIPRRGGYIMQNLGGFMCYIFRTKPRIFNPATRQLVIIPPLGEGYKFVSYFFGHDLVNDQYKVVCLKLLQEARSEHWVFVLKPGGGSWKKVAPDFCPHIPCPQRRLCIDGVIYYLAWIGMYNYVIVSFHIRSEEFKTIQVPRNGLPERFKNLSLLDYGGKLTLLDQTNLRDKGMLDLWVVEDAANKEWSRKTLLLQPSQLRLVNNIIFKVKCTTQNGKLFLIPQDFLSPFHILCYDLQSNDMIKIEIKGIPDHWFSKDKANIRFDLMFMDQSESVIYL